MSLFWILAAGLLVLALVFVLLPLLRGRSRPAAATTSDELNIAVHRQQLEELESDLAAGELDQAQFASAKADLQRELLEDVGTATPGTQAAAIRSGRWAAIVLVLAVPLLSVSLYQHLGAIDKLALLKVSAKRPPQQAEPAVKHQGQPNMETLVARLAERMRQQPDNLEGWMMLGRSYMVLGRKQDALKAYETAYKLAPENVEVLASLASALAEAQGNRLAGRPGELLRQAEKLKPDNANTQWLLGLLDFQEQRYQGAISRWEKLAASLTAGSEDARAIEGYIAKARSRLSAGSAAEGSPQLAAVADETPPPTESGATQSSLSVEVSLDPALRDRVSDGDTVFIFARALQGPPMPLAALRSRVADLPLTVTLHDGQAMVPTMKLSAFEEVVVGARVSLSGQPVPQSGDLHGEVSPVPTSTGEPVRVVISEIIP